MLRIVSATRRSKATFADSRLGRTIRNLQTRGGVVADIAYDNQTGLPEVYNAAIDRAEAEDNLAFIHDDVFVHDWFLPERVTEGLSRFSVIGVAGNRRRVPRQPAWAFIDDKFTWDAFDNLSGAVAHDVRGATAISRYGPTPVPVVLLDGVFLAVRAATLKQAGVRFDTRFHFHCYDLDFCRACERAGLTLGTWPIALTHASGGHFGVPAWRKAFEAYLSKWGD